MTDCTLKKLDIKKINKKQFTPIDNNNKKRKQQ